MLRITLIFASVAAIAATALAEPTPPPTSPISQPMRSLQVAGKPAAIQALAGIKIFRSGVSKPTTSQELGFLPPNMPKAAPGAGAQFNQIKANITTAAAPVTLTPSQPDIPKSGYVMIGTKGGEIYANPSMNAIFIHNSQAWLKEVLNADAGKTYLVDTLFIANPKGECQITITSDYGDSVSTPCQGNDKFQHLLFAFKNEGSYMTTDTFTVKLSGAGELIFYSATISKLD